MTCFSNIENDGFSVRLNFCATAFVLQYMHGFVGVSRVSLNQLQGPIFDRALDDLLGVSSVEFYEVIRTFDCHSDFHFVDNTDHGPFLPKSTTAALSPQH